MRRRRWRHSACRKRLASATCLCIPRRFPSSSRHWPTSRTGGALLLWWSCSAVIYGLCCYSIWRGCPNLRARGGLVALLAAAYPAFFHLIAWGQTSAVALACFTLMFFRLRDRREFLAGLILGCLIFKPQLGLAAAIVFVSIGAWKTVVGAALSAAGQLCRSEFSITESNHFVNGCACCGMYLLCCL